MTGARIRWTRHLLTLGLTLGGLSVAACAFSWNGFTLVEWWRESHSGQVLCGARTRQPVVALTFDDGPDPRFTPRILDTLRRYGVKATFFDTGRHVLAYPALARLEVKRGHQIGNHTFSHPYLERQSARKVRSEVTDCETALYRTLGLRSHLFRPPRGTWNPTIFREARRQGDRIILWTVALDHHGVKTPRASAARVMRLVQPGGIILMHDGGGSSREMTVRALPLLLDGLRKRGYRCVTVPELLHISGDETVVKKRSTPQCLSTPPSAKQI